MKTNVELYNKGLFKWKNKFINNFFIELYFFGFLNIFIKNNIRFIFENLYPAFNINYVKFFNIIKIRFYLNFKLKKQNN